MDVAEPTHSDILVMLGELKGGQASLITMFAQKREDLNALGGRVGTLEKYSASHSEVEQAEQRISVLEKEMAKWVGISLSAAIALPLLVPFIERGFTHLDKAPAGILRPIELNR